VTKAPIKMTKNRQNHSEQCWHRRGNKFLMNINKKSGCWKQQNT